MLIPLIWKRHIRDFLSLLGISLSVMILVLLAMRIDEIGRLASLGAPLSEIGKFFLYQIPHFFSFSLSLATLIAAFLLSSRLSSSFELTALRSFGLSLKEIFLPLFALGWLLVLLTFFVTSELKPKVRLLKHDLAHSSKHINPLLALSKNQLGKRFEGYSELHLNLQKNRAQKPLIAMYNPHIDKIQLFLADSLRIEDGIIGQNLSVISHFPAGDDLEDHLLIHSLKELKIPMEILTDLATRTKLPRAYDIASTKTLLKHLKTSFHLSDLREALNRFSMSLLPLSFLILGISFGFQSHRSKKSQGTMLLSILVILTFASFFAAKSLGSRWSLIALFYTLPHLVIWSVGTYRFYRLNRGALC